MEYQKSSLDVKKLTLSLVMENKSKKENCIENVRMLRTCTR